MIAVIRRGYKEFDRGPTQYRESDKDLLDLPPPTPLEAEVTPSPWSGGERLDLG